MEKLAIKDLVQNQVFDFGSITLSEEEIMKYAREFDPLIFHTDKKAAEASMFKGLVSSGPQIFNTFYKVKWVPLFGSTVLCGLELNNWKFLKPVYANAPTACKVTIKGLHKNELKGHAVIVWNYQFFDTKNELIQIADVTVMHKL